MPDWYRVIVTARYAGIPAHEFLRLPVWWQDVYETARVAEAEAGMAEVVSE
jgi:hypothetical protein